MSRLYDIMQEQNMEDLEKIAAGGDSILVKVACALTKAAMDGESALSFPQNPILISLAQQMAQDPGAGAGPYHDLLGQLLQADLQNALQKVQMEGTLAPMKLEAERVKTMVDMMRAKLEGARHAKEMHKMQAEMAAEMGLAQQNAAVQATAQMPKGVAPPNQPQPDQAAPPQAQPGPPAGGPPVGPPPGGGPMNPPPAG